MNQFSIRICMYIYIYIYTFLLFYSTHSNHVRSTELWLQLPEHVNTFFPIDTSFLDDLAPWIFVSNKFFGACRIVFQKINYLQKYSLAEKRRGAGSRNFDANSHMKFFTGFNFLVIYALQNILCSNKNSDRHLIWFWISWAVILILKNRKMFIICASLLIFWTLSEAKIHNTFIKKRTVQINI